MSLDFSHINTVFSDYNTKKREYFLQNQKKEIESLFDNYIEWIKEQTTDKNIVNAIKVEELTKGKPENGLKITFSRKNNHIGQICAFFSNKVKYHPEIVQSWKEKTIKELGCTVVGYNNIQWKKPIDKGFDIQTEIISYTIYLIGKDNTDYYEHIFRTLLNNEHSLTDL